MRYTLLTAALLTTAYLHGQVITTPPQGSNIRAMAEWEELQSLNITWTGFPAILKQIVAAAKEEVQVLIITDNPGETEDYLMTDNTGGDAFIDMNNITLIEGDFNTIWTRDYSANPVYTNEVDSLVLVDWIYNRPRPDDDASPELIAAELGVELYATVESPNELMNTGGNFMCDGFGTAFASELVLDENDGDGDNNQLDYPDHTETEIDDIILQFMGIDRYIKMPTLPYDGIHHIDMHMKLVNEETLLVSEYPDGVADGPQINANIEYVLANYNSLWDTPYRVVHIPAPPSTSGLYPDDGGAYRTYTNGVFVNNTIIFPTYREEYDTTAYRIWGEVCPGYNLVGIDCDNQGNNIISQSGAIHCITHAVGVEDPLLISHQPQQDTYDDENPYALSAYMSHRDGVDNGMVYWRINDDTDWQEITMTDAGGGNWLASIPAQAIGTFIHYYIRGEATTGKVQVRPMPAPNGFWTFEVLGPVNVMDALMASFVKVFPNPANAITCTEISFAMPQQGELYIADLSGRKVLEIHSGIFKNGVSKYFFDAKNLTAGAYRIVLQTEFAATTELLMVK
ncbi:MAG: agmatine deiminase family protein [Flavobacteriales bacterium]